MAHKTTHGVTLYHWKNVALTGAALGLAAVTSADAQSVDHGVHMIVAANQTEGGEGGEGGETGAAEDERPAVGFLTELALIEGHLRAGIELYREGRADLAITHMKHPRDEIYASLEPKLTAFGVPDFADELAALAVAVESGAPLAEAEAAFAGVAARIDTARAPAEANPRDVLKSLEAVMRVAAEEYAIGVMDGKIDNLHEYQDAWGFSKVALAQAGALAASDDPIVRNAAGEAVIAIETVDANFTGLVPSGTLDGDASLLMVAAARIELAAYSVK